MSLSRSDLTEEVLKREYVANGLGIEEIARKYHMSDEPISTTLRNLELRLTRKDLTKGVLQLEYIENLLTTVEIAKKYHVEAAYVTRRLNDHHIERFLNKTFRRRATLSLTPLQEELVFGSLCGDSSIGIDNNTKDKSCYFEVSHKIVHVDYLLWKRKILDDWIPFEEPYKIESSCYSDRYPRFHLYAHIYTFVAPIFNMLRKLFYPNGKKVMSRRILNQLTPLGLATWFMDDGGRLNSTSIGISGGWTDSELIDLVNYFNERWNIIVKIDRELHEKGRDLVFNKESSKKLVSIIMPYMHPIMMYKLRSVI